MLPQDRRLRPQGNGVHLVIIDGEVIGTVYPYNHESLPSYLTTKKQRETAYEQRVGRWIAKLATSEHRLPYAFDDMKAAAIRLTDTWLFDELRQREIRTLDDAELERLIEFERGVEFSIGQSDALGTAAKLHTHFEKYLEPLYRERNDRERRRKAGGPD